MRPGLLWPLLLAGCLTNQELDAKLAEHLPTSTVDESVPEQWLLLAYGSESLFVGETLLAAAQLATDASLTEVEARWTSSDPSVAIVHAGTIIGLSAGVVIIQAEVGGLEATAELAVVEPTLTSLVIDAPATHLEMSNSLQLAATANWSSGTSEDVTGLVEWWSADQDIADVDAAGLVTGSEPGATIIRAKLDGLASTVEITVDAPDSPDLEVTAFGVHCHDEGVQVDVSVRNRGGVDAGSFWLDIYFDPALPPVRGEYGDTYVQVDSLTAGGLLTHTFTLPPAEGSHSLYAQVDSENEVAEFNEENNILGESYDLAVGAGANLRVVDVTVIAEASAVFYTVLVENSGVYPAHNFYVDTFVDPPEAPDVGAFGDEYVNVVSLEPGFRTEVTLAVSANCGAGCASWIVVDSDDNVSETIESDNLFGPLQVE